MLWKCCTQYASKFGNLNSGCRTGKGFIPVPKKGIAKECSNYCTIILISHTSTVMLKMPEARFQQYMNQELPDVQAGFRKGRGTRDQIANIFLDHWKTKGLPENISFWFIDYTKAFDCGSQQTGKFFKRSEYQITLPASWENCMQVQK